MAIKNMKILKALATLSLCLGLIFPFEHLWAQSRSKSNSNSRKQEENQPQRRRVLGSEKTVRQDQKKIDFDDADISGERSAPLGTVVDRVKNRNEYDLIKLRLRWHPEMVQSTSSFETGRGQ
jgi:hypothetical protein